MVDRKRLRLLVLGDSRSFHIERYLAELRKQDCEVLVASIEAGKIDYYQLRWRGPIRQLHYVLAVKELRELTAKFEPDVVDAHYASGYGYMAAVALEKSTIPIIVQLWGSDILVVPQKSLLHKRKVVKALNKAEAVVADSEYLLNEAKRLMPLKRTLTEAFGIEKRFLEFHRQDYTLSQPLKIIVPRPHEEVYNNSFILKALGPLLESESIAVTFPDFGSLAIEFKWEVKNAGCRGISFYEKMERESFLRFMSEHDVYLSAALSDSSPVSLIEAMALGLIPVVAKIPGVSEWADNTSAILFEIDDGIGLANSIKEIISSNEGRAEMLKRNLERVREKGLFENNVAARIDLMKQLIGHQ